MKYFKIIIWPVLFAIGQFFVRYLFVLYFNFKYYGDVNLYDVINTYEYQNKLNQFIDSNTLPIVIICAVFFIPLLFIVYRKDKIKTGINSCKNVYKYLILGVVSAIFYNLYLSFIIDYKLSSLPIYVQILSSGIIGPIIEELLFRGIVYNRIKKYYSLKASMILSTIIFAFMHFSLIDNFYTMFFGYLLVYVYETSNSIKYSMFIHICSNICVILLSIIISFNYIFINLFIFVICFIILCIFFLKKYIYIK